METPPLVLANWKMNLTARQAVAYLHDLLPRLPARADREVAVAPSFTSLPAVAPLLKETSVGLAAQDVFWESEGAYTGEISPMMLQDLGVRYVLVGHSERRRHLGETDRMVNRKVLAALGSGLNPVLCVGEQETARVSGRARSVVRTQLLRALADVPRSATPGLTIAYEPVWAIGTGRAATPRDVTEMHACIRSELQRVYGEAGGAPRILYGGSVDAGNIDAFMECPEVQGVLVGGASIRLDDFVRIAGFRGPS